MRFSSPSEVHTGALNVAASLLTHSMLKLLLGAVLWQCWCLLQVQKGEAKPANKRKKGSQKGKQNSTKKSDTASSTQQQGAKGSVKGLLQLRRESGSAVVIVGRNNLQNERITFQVFSSLIQLYYTTVPLDK
jgi:hypothetical protein